MITVLAYWKFAHGILHRGPEEQQQRRCVLGLEDARRVPPGQPTFALIETSDTPHFIANTRQEPLPHQVDNPHVAVPVACSVSPRWSTRC